MPEQVRELRDEWLQAGGEVLDERYSVRDAAHTVERVTEDVCVDTGLRLRGGIDGFDVFAQRQDIAKALGFAGQLLQAKVFDKHEIETRVGDDVASERDRLRGAELAVELLHGRLGAGTVATPHKTMRSGLRPRFCSRLPDIPGGLCSLIVRRS